MFHKAGKVIEIDTKEMCVLCYDPCGNSNKRGSSLIGFKQLLRYLKVNIKQLFNCSPGFLQWMEIKQEIDVQITLCTKCSLVAEEFDKLYKQYEEIQFQFDKCIISLHQSMKSGDANPERVREFKKQMYPNKSFDLINASIAANLRDQTLKKCALKLENSLPRVTVQKIKETDTHTHIAFNDSSDCHFNRSDQSKLTTVPATVRKVNIIDTDNDQVIQEQPILFTQSFEVIENDPLEMDTNLTNLLDDGESTDVAAPPIHFSAASANSPTSVVTGISPLTKRNRARAKGPKPCDVCHKIFEHNCDIRRHRLVLHPEHIVFKHYSSKLSLSLLQCKELVDNFFKNSVAKSVGPDGIKCCFCTKALSNMSTLKAHFISQHMELVVDGDQELGPSTSKKIRMAVERCDQCSKVFSTKAELNKHKTTHLLQHMLDPHFNELVTETPDYLDGTQGGGGGGVEVDEGSQQEMIIHSPVDVQMEFETENVKMEGGVVSVLDSDNDSESEVLFDPLSVDYLNLD